ncbi:hypothetical protein CPC08DRAFT_708389 [Agrocybe pediades]|nr:hypothetical protein CPC08DRAFT_708389 [Agrocybe pediades]
MIVVNADILWLIFWQNAIDEQTARITRLHAARTCSQVCHLWRTILVGSPLIWSRLLVISQEFHPEWINEVLRRSSSSPLWVDILLSYYERTEGLKHLLIMAFNIILRDNWKRLHTLDMTLLGPFQDVLTVHDWTPFFQPAPMLRSCSVMATFPYLGPPKYRPVFSNNAPFLRTFRSNFLPIPQAAAAVRQMRDLTFYEGDVGGVLRSLRSMPYLEKLVIHWKSNIQDSHSFHEVVKLPFLNHLETTTSVNVLVALLDGLSILPFTLRIINCVLRIQHLSLPTLDSNSLRERMERLVKSHGQSGVPVPELCHLHLTFNYNGLKLVMDPSFTLEVFTNFLIQDKADATNLVNAFKLRKLSEITFLVLRVSESDHYYTSLTPLLTLMYSVTTLDVLETFFPVANLEADHGDDEVVLFPQLHTLCIDRILLFKHQLRLVTCTQ